MTRNIFIATAEPYSGKSIVALGLVDMLLSKAQKIGYYKPIVNFAPETEQDPHIETVLNHFNLPIRYEDTFAYTQQEALHLIESGRQGEIIDRIISHFKKLEESCDFTVIEGSDFLGQGTAFQFDANVTIAKNLGAPVIIVASAEGETSEQIISSVRTIKRNFEVRDVQVLAVIANKVSPEQLGEVNAYFKSQQQSQTTYAAIPEEQNLKSPSMKEVLEVLGGNCFSVSSSFSTRSITPSWGPCRCPTS
ncbi:AAA family ATPase [Pontibacter chitinilyticus]|uniref:AAA family ATPase n=1 Tax=Pontibacter chitinilyticus TaxID=2674989 RepID=UPI00321A1A5A